MRWQSWLPLGVCLISCNSPLDGPHRITKRAQPAAINKDAASKIRAHAERAHAAPRQISDSSEHIRADVGLTSPTAASSHEAADGTRSSTSQPVGRYRPDDLRPSHDERLVEQAGIKKYISERMVLYTDHEQKQTVFLPQLGDQLLQELESYFGGLPPARDGRLFQITGYIMRDLERFVQAGMIPPELPPFIHGRHQGNRFWMRHQEHEYYLRHLMFHEITHCFMTYLPETQAPLWYLEGMAELFGTHSLETGNKIEFGVLPNNPDEAAGWGRITLIRQDISSGAFRSLADVFGWSGPEYAHPRAYAWAWAVCYLLSQHSRYRDLFQEMRNDLWNGTFEDHFWLRFGPLRDELYADWTVFISGLQYGYQLSQAEVVWRRGEGLSKEATVDVEVLANRGWQASGVMLQKDVWYRIEASGQFLMGKDDRLLPCEPQGITVDYYEGVPLGTLIGCIREEPCQEIGMVSSLRERIILGRSTRFLSTRRGTLYLRVNDAWNSLADNVGSCRVRIHRE